MIGGAFWPHSEKVITVVCQATSWGSSPHVVAVPPGLRILGDFFEWPGTVTNPLPLRLDTIFPQTVDSKHEENIHGVLQEWQQGCH